MRTKLTSQCFSVNSLNAKFFKRVNKNYRMIETAINDNFQGLYDYFTAPNIRKKIRHPIFLAIRFASCVKFFYNTGIFPSSTVTLLINLKLKEILMLLQVALATEEQESQCSKDFRNLALLKIIIPDSSQELAAKKIIDGICLPETTPLRIILSTEAIPAGYVMVTCMVTPNLQN